MDQATHHLLTAISDALDGMADWRAVRVRHAATEALSGRDFGTVADDLDDFTATQREVTPNEQR